MTQLDDHLQRVEEYGFVRRQFPVQYNEHRLLILNNDAYILEDGRLLFDFTLYCDNCERTNSISGRFPVEFDDQMAGVVNAKIAVFRKFYEMECQGK